MALILPGEGKMKDSFYLMALNLDKTVILLLLCNFQAIYPIILI